MDGLVIPAQPSATTRETISMLALEASCAESGADCAERILETPGTLRAATRLVAASDLLFLHARKTRGPERETAFRRCGQLTHRYLTEAGLAGRRGPLDARSQMAFRLHNACTAGLVQTLGSQLESLDWEVDEQRFPRHAVERIELADALRVSGLRTRQVDDGIGVPAVAFGYAHEPIGAFPAQPFALAITVRLAFDSDGAARLVVTDASQSRSVETVFGPVPLARDMSVAYAGAAIAFEEELSRWEALLGALPGDEATQIRLLAPVDDTKTPVLLIHGLASSPMAWANMINELLGDPDISAHYQFWMARYPTGLPILVNRQNLARAIDDFRAITGTSPESPLQSMIVVGHSMGGVLTRLLVTDPGTALWEAAFDAPPEQLAGSPEDIAAARDLFVFEPIGGVEEVVFIATPHGGSVRADGPLASLVRGLIKGPGRTLEFLTRLARSNLERVRPDLRDNYQRGGPDSLNTLSPSQPVIQAARHLPIVPGIKTHSVIGIVDPALPAKGDGVVSLESASWPADAEYRIEGGHNLHTVPETILTLKGILLARLPSYAPGSDEH
ncbi:MAG: hypothetical protein U1A73_12905 [Pseudomonas sp.]|nr:hypothetical protein [Pseudomonas sp.]